MARALVSALFLLLSLAAVPGDRVEERTLWPACWTDDGDIVLPSDRNPGVMVCDSPAPIVWSHLPLRVGFVQPVREHAEEVDRTLAAMSLWNAWVGFDMFVLATSDPDVLISFEDKDPRVAGFTHLAKDPEESMRLYAVVLIFGPQPVEVHAHELGHVLGLAHDMVEPPDSIMSAFSRHLLLAPTKADVNAIRTLYGRNSIL